jgi:hypothetical protein
MLEVTGALLLAVNAQVHDTAIKATAKTTDAIFQGVALFFFSIIVSSYVLN